MEGHAGGLAGSSELVRTIYERCTAGRQDRVITATDVYRYWQSPFGLYCRHFVDASNRDPKDEAKEYHARVGRDYEKAVTSERYPGVLKIEGDDMSGTFLAVLRAMEAGTETILNGALMNRPNRMMGEPDVMVREGGKSAFGDYHYHVVEIKSTANIRAQHILQTAFYNRLLGVIQNHTPDTFTILDGNRDERQYLYNGHAGLLADTMAGVEALTGGRKPSPTYGACPYPWSNYNDNEAVKTGDISLVSGLGAEKKRALAGLGITTLDGLINAGAEGLTKARGVSTKTARGYIIGAKALKTGRPERRDGYGHTLHREGIEVYVNFEGMDDGDRHAMFLIGVVVRSGDSEEYVPFLAGRNGEGRMLRDFLAYIAELKPAAVYHWHNFRPTQIARLRQEHGIGDGEAAPLVSGGTLQDLYRIATGMYAFPVPGTSIKSLASWLGFKWRHQDISEISQGTSYKAYLDGSESGTADMQRVIDYNRDYCMAIMAVKKWLECNA